MLSIIAAISVYARWSPICKYYGYKVALRSKNFFCNFSLPYKLFFLLDMVKVVNLQGKLKSSKRQASELHFDFSINCIGEELICLFLCYYR
jgi:hypothetical protein